MLCPLVLSKVNCPTGSTLYIFIFDRYCGLCLFWEYHFLNAQVLSKDVILFSLKNVLDKVNLCRIERGRAAHPGTGRACKHSWALQPRARRRSRDRSLGGSRVRSVPLNRPIWLYTVCSMGSVCGHLLKNLLLIFFISKSDFFFFKCRLGGVSFNPKYFPMTKKARQTDCPIVYNIVDLEKK